MKPNKLSILIIVILLLVCGDFIAAQTGGDNNIPNLIMIREKGSKGEKTDEIGLVRQLISSGAYMAAANLLEDLYSRQPDNREITELLLGCYSNLKAYPKAEMLLRKKLETDPFDMHYHDRLLEIYLRIGDDSLINNHIDNILDKFPGNSDIYQLIIKKLTSTGYSEVASELITRGRAEFTSDYLFAIEAASIFEIRGDYYQAVMEYFKIVDSDSLITKSVDRKMAALIRYPGASPDIIVALNDILDSLPDNKLALKFLQETYVRNNQHEKAFDISIKFDSLSDGTGRELFKYMRQCRERKLHRQVVKVGEYLEQLNSGNVPYADYKFYYAEGLVGLGRFDDAILCYRQIFKKYPKAHDKAEALMEIGNVFRYHIYNFDSALVYYDSVVNHYLIEPINTASLYERAKLFLVYSELDKAKNAFLSLKEKCRSTEMKELMDYYLAMIHLYNNEFEEADMSFRMLIKTYPRGYYVNDALISSLIIGETLPSSPEALAGYAEALFYETRLMPDSVVSKYKTVINMGATPIVGLAMYKLALYYSNLGDTTASLEMIEKMDSLYSEDYFFPYVLKLKADIYSDNVEKRETAVEIYKDILQNYSTYPFIGETREALQRIQDSEPIG